MSKKPEKTATYVVSCTTPKGSEYYRTQRHRWCRPMPGMNDDTWLLFPSHASATGYLSTMNLDEMDEETRATITVKEIWL